MRRRTLVGWLLSAIASMRLGLRLPAHAQQTLGESAAETLRAVAEVVLPADAGPPEAVVAGFRRWLREHRPGADMGHGYGILRQRVRPAIDAAGYERQLAALEGDGAARPFAARPLAERRRQIESALRAGGVRRLPSRPDGAHVVTDLMSFYYFGSDAHDRCYGASIRRDACRGLAGMGERPPAI